MRKLQNTCNEITASLCIDFCIEDICPLCFGEKRYIKSGNPKERLNQNKRKEKEKNRKAKNRKGEMEDCVIDPMNLSPRGDDREEEKRKKDEEERPSGFINHLLFNLVSGGEAEEEKVDKEDDEKSKDEDKGGGLISHLISNLVSPRSQKPGKVEPFEVENGGSKAEENVGVDGNGGRLKQGKTEGESSGGGVIKNLISHLPDDAAPTADEAAILIHSIVHD